MSRATRAGLAAVIVAVVAAGCRGDDDSPASGTRGPVARAPFFGIVAEDVLAGDAAYRR